MQYAYKGTTPRIAASARLFEGARVIGDVTLGERVGVWYNAVIRGDMAPVTIGDETNVQDGVIIHTNTDLPTIIGHGVTIGHNAIIHAATVGNEALIGMGSIILDGATVGDYALVAAGCTVPPGKTVPARHLAVGNPMKVVRELSDEEVEGIRKNTAYYVGLLEDYDA